MISELIPLNREEHELFNEILIREFGLHFPDSKRQILQSRLEPRLRELRLRRFLDYYLKLQYDLTGERDALIHRVTNNETYFFREKGQFEALFGPGLELLRESSSTPHRLRLLSAGCSTGEEPYTLGIYALENRFLLGSMAVEVEAFDLDRECLATARSGIYGPRSLRATDPEKAARYFREVGEGRVALKPPFRAGVRFRSGNIIDPFAFGGAEKFDAIFCRNVLIYFSEGALHRAIENFARGLRPGGLLFLGHSESIIGLSPLFETVRLDSCIAYKRTFP